MFPPGGTRQGRRERAARASERAYRWLLRAYPRGLRDGYGEEMARCFRDLCREELDDGGGLPGLGVLWVRTLPELLYTALKERSTMSSRNAYRSVFGVALVTAFVLLLPLLTGAPWGLADFVIAGGFVFGTGLAYVLVARKAGNTAYRFAAAIALMAALILVWVNLAVGVIGTEDNLANSMYVGVLAVGVVGAIVARFRPRGMASAMFATALAQALVAGISLVFGLGYPWSPPVELLAVNGFFATLFVVSALLFRYAARGQTPSGQEG